MTSSVLFGQSYYLRFDLKLWDAQQPYAPLGTLYAAAFLRARGHQVAVFDAMLASSELEWSAALDHHHPSVAVIYEDNFNYLSKMCLLRMREAALTMIQAARVRGVTVIVAGSDATDHAAIYLDGGADLVVIGEGEITVAEAIDALSSGGGALSDVAGLCMRDARGRLVRTPPRPLIKNLDELPRPAWDLIDVERYRAIWLQRHGVFSMNLSTTRGCPYHCNWCAKPIYGQRYTVRSPVNVVNEMAWLKETYRPDHLWIVDDIFGLTPGWIEHFAALATERGVVIPFKCLLRADGVNERTSAALAAAGARTAWIGAESGSQRILDAMEKGTRVEDIVQATRLLRSHGVEVGFFLQFGYLDETLEDIGRTLQMVRDCRPDDIGISVSYPLPGTTFYERVRAQLGTKQNWVDSDDLAMMYRAHFVPEFYRVLHQLVHAEFRARAAVRAFSRAPRSGEAQSTFARRLRGLAAGAFHAARIPALTLRVRKLARATTAATGAPTITPVLSPRAAAAPTEQPR